MSRVRLMPFTYPDRRHSRKHGPSGYRDYTSFKPWLRDEFRFRCVYCLERERWSSSGHAAFAVDHVRPQGNPEFASLVCDYKNLVYACNRCNSAKRDQLLLNPCKVWMSRHLSIAEDGAIVGLTTEGRHLVNCLGLATPQSQGIRQRCLRILSLYRANPNDPHVRALYVDYFGYPDDLPNLAALRPTRNTRPTGIVDAYFRQREEGRLPETYF